MFRKSSKTLTTADEAYEYALSLLDRREHGEKELSQKLKRKGFTVPLISETLAKLKRFNLLNEERYARRVFELWRNKRIYGRLHLQAELEKNRWRIPISVCFCRSLRIRRKKNMCWQPVICYVKDMMPSMM